jgi:hypothetical protein
LSAGTRGGGKPGGSDHCHGSSTTSAVVLVDSPVGDEALEVASSLELVSLEVDSIGIAELAPLVSTAEASGA